MSARRSKAIARCPPMPLGVVAGIGVDRARALQWMTAQSAHRRNGVAAQLRRRYAVTCRAGVSL